MSHRWLASLAILVALSMSGCMCIHGVGTGCLEDCEQCNGCGPRPIPMNPCQDLWQVRKSLVCSGGCGEVYYGEWFSTPPDCEDPCDCCQQWTPGCGEKCFPCVRLGAIFSCLHGKRLRCDTTPDLFDICRICGDSCCESGCDVCPSCCDDEGYDDGASIISDGGSWSEQMDDSVSGTTAPVTGQFKPMPRTRVASASTMRMPTQSKSSCNCGKHAP